MSWLPDQDPIPGDRKSCDAIEHVIVPRSRDLGGFEVRRALPSAKTQMVGPFIFFDQMGPAEFIPGTGIDVRPHPHIGLATVTYLFEGEIWHRDSLGTSMPIRPGDVNLMSAGRGIVHSEREAPEVKSQTRRMFGIQAWCALPKSHEETAPTFVHHGVEALPRITGEGKRVRLIMGSAFGKTAPAEFPHPTLYAEAVLAPGANPAVRCRLRGARDIYRVRHRRHCRTNVRGRPVADVQAGRSHLHFSDVANPPDDARRRTDGWATSHLVELRVIVERPHRRCQGGLASEAVRAGARRRGRADRTAGVSRLPHFESTLVFAATGCC